MASKYTGVTKDPKTGTYSYYFKAGVDLATGKPFQKRKRGFPTAKAAHEARTKALQKIQDRGSVSYTQMTFKQFMEIIYIPDFNQRTAKDIEGRNRMIFNEFIQRFGSKKPNNITIQDITIYKNELIQKYSSSYGRRKMAMLKTIFKSAQNYGLIHGDNVMEKVPLIKIKKAEVHYWTKSEFEQFINSLDTSSYMQQFIYTTVWLYFFTGMRVNEGTALYWEDVDFGKKLLSIHHNLHYLNIDNCERSTKLKTESSKRTIGLDDNTLDILQKWKERQQKHSKIKFVLSYDGNPFPKRSFAYQLKKYSEKAGVPYIKPKGLRHSHASLLINEWNTTPLAIQKRLGHSDVQTTLSVYSHLYPNFDKEITENLKNLI